MFLFCLRGFSITARGLNQDMGGPCVVPINPDAHSFLYPRFPICCCPFWCVLIGFYYGGEKHSSIFKYEQDCKWFTEIAQKHMLDSRVCLLSCTVRCVTPLRHGNRSKTLSFLLLSLAFSLLPSTCGSLARPTPSSVSQDV